jgi:lysozyme
LSDASVISTGIDVSRHQGLKLDWRSIRNVDKVEYAFCKATEAQGYVDESFARNIAEARAAGVLTGSYHYFHAKRPADLQAENYFKVAGSLDLDLPPVLDFESLQGIPVNDAIHRADEFILLTEKLWRRPVLVYTYPSFWLQLQKPSLEPLSRYKLSQICRRDLWIAHYGVANPNIPWPWSSYKFWQYDGDGGRRLAQGVDCDFNRFNGDIRAYCDLSKIPPAHSSIPVRERISVMDGPANPLGWADRAERDAAERE